MNLRHCDGKMKFLSERAATIAIGTLNRNRRRTPSPRRPLEAYLCPSCRFWHFGHRPKWRRA